MKRFGIMFFLFSLLVMLNVHTVLVAADDFDLPPPPDADEELLPPGDDFGGDEIPPPPGDDFASDDMPPPADEFAESDVPPPAEEESEDVPPPPSDEEYAEEEEEEAPAPVKVASSKSGKLSKYRVSSGDSLWRISGKSKIYGDSFKWPLIYKANKALIEDPDLIYPRQNFEINQNFSDDVIDDAVGKAKETPRYEPHTEPRKKLPIKY